MLDLDGILHELGQFGRYQIKIFVLIFFPLVLYSTWTVSYVFTTGDLDYRCLIPECEGNSSESYQVPWSHYSVPYENGLVKDKCMRFKLKNNYDNCTKDNFDTSKTEFCNRYVFETDENTMLKEFGLLCAENTWKRTLIGTLNNIGQFIGLPIGGVLSDRFGRKTMILICVLLSSVFGTLRSFTNTYIQFATCEVLDAIAYAGVYSGLFVWGVEVIGPKKRGLGGAIISMFYSIGEMLLGVVVWLVHDWRTYLRILYFPGYLFIIYIWIAPESIRWLISNGKNEKIVDTLNTIASINKKPISEDLRKEIENLTNPEEQKVLVKQSINNEEEKVKNPLREALKSKIILFRVLNCSFCWITHTFVFYGLSLNSVGIAGNKYLNFILVCFVEIPGYFLTWVLLDRVGRRISLLLGLGVSGIACTAFYFASKDAYTIRLVLFLAGKLAITESFGALYVMASEIYPTGLRHSLLSFCSTLGRIGSMVAPQTPLLASVIDPVLVFGAISFAAAVLALFFPETLNTKMPETIQEAEALGKKKIAETQKG